MERLQALLQEILQCERNYETQLRRVGSIRKDINKNIQEGTSTGVQATANKDGGNSSAITGQNHHDNHSTIYNLAVQSLQNYCLNKADLIKRDSKFLRESIFLNLSKTVKEQQEHTQKLTEKGNELIQQLKHMQKKIYAFNQKYLKDVADKKKDDGLFSFLKRKIKRDVSTSLKESKVDNLDEQANINLSKEQKEF